VSADAQRNVMALPSASREELAAHWSKLYRSRPPSGVSRRLLERAVAYALQAKRFGGLSAKARRQLERGARSSLAPQAQGQRSLAPGTRLMRTWNGVSHVVDVVEDGFLWNGERHRSLSAIANAITGARWSGPRFFGITR